MMATRDLLARLDLAVKKNKLAASELDAALSDQEDVTRRLRMAANELRAHQQKKGSK